MTNGNHLPKNGFNYDKLIDFGNHKLYHILTMEYENTYKLYFKLNQDDFKNELEKKLKSDDTILFSLEINNHQSFFHYNRFVFEKLLSVETKNAELNSVFDSLPQIAKNQYIRNTLVAEVKNTNELEGVFSSRKEIFELTEDFKKCKSDKIGSIVKKYMLLMSDDGEKEISSCRDIRNTYNDLFNLDGKSLIEDKDKPDGNYFRKGFVGVYDGDGNLIHKGLSGENTIIEAMEEALSILNNESINMYIRLALFHYIFEYAHPYYDGNGRLGRYLLSLMIKKEKSDIFAFRVSSGINSRKSKYYKAFEVTEDPRNYGDLGTFVYELLSIFEQEYIDSIHYAKNKKKLMDSLYKELIDMNDEYSKNEKEVLYLLIQAYVFSDFGVSVNEITSITKISSRTIRRLISSFKEKGMLKEERFGKVIYYNLNKTSLDDGNLK